MVKLVQSPISGDKYHLPECRYKGKKTVFLLWAKDKSLAEVVSETYKKKGMAQPCEHCVMSVKTTYTLNPHYDPNTPVNKCHCGERLFRCGDVEDGWHCLSCGYYRHGSDIGHGEGYPNSCVFKTGE